MAKEMRGDASHPHSFFLHVHSSFASCALLLLFFIQQNESTRKKEQEWGEVGGE